MNKWAISYLELECHYNRTRDTENTWNAELSGNSALMSKGRLRKCLLMTIFLSLRLLTEKRLAGLKEEA